MNKKQVEEIKRNAYARGWDDGYIDGVKNGEKKGIKIAFQAIIELINDE